MYERILVATDGSDLSKKAEQSAIALAVALHVPLVVVSVVPKYPMSYFEGAVGISFEKRELTERSWTDNAQAALDEVCERAKAHGVDARSAIYHSDLVAESILKAATKYKCDLIVMASHGRKGVARVLLGSETLHVLTHGTVPVLVLR